MKIVAAALPRLACCGGPPRVAPRAVPEAEPSVVVATPMSGPYARLEDWCAPFLAEQSDERGLERECPAAIETAWVTHGRCADQGCCTSHAGHGGKDCEPHDLTPLNNAT